MVLSDSYLESLEKVFETTVLGRPLPVMCETNIYGFKNKVCKVSFSFLGGACVYVVTYLT